MTVRKKDDGDADAGDKKKYGINENLKEKNFYIRFFLYFYNLSNSNFLVMGIFVTLLFFGGDLIVKSVPKINRGYAVVALLIFSLPIYAAFICSALTKVFYICFEPPMRKNHSEFDTFDYMKFEAGIHELAPGSIYIPALDDSIDKQLSAAIKNEEKRQKQGLIQGNNSELLTRDHQKNDHSSSKSSLVQPEREIEVQRKMDLSHKPVLTRDVLRPAIDPYLDIAKASGNSLLDFSGQGHADLKKPSNNLSLQPTFEKFFKDEEHVSIAMIKNKFPPHGVSQNHVENGFSVGRNFITCFCYICVSDRDVEILQNGDKRCCSCKQFI